MAGVVTSVSRSARHTLVKPNEDTIRLLVGLGVEGDAHSGATVKHRSRVARDPNQPNLRQVHLIHAELHDELRERGLAVSAEQMGENVTTRGVDLLGLPTSARLYLGSSAVVEVTGYWSAQPLRPARPHSAGVDGGDVGTRRIRQPRPARPASWAS